MRRGCEQTDSRPFPVIWYCYVRRPAGSLLVAYDGLQAVSSTKPQGDKCIVSKVPQTVDLNCLMACTQQQTQQQYQLGGTHAINLRTTVRWRATQAETTLTWCLMLVQKQPN